MNYLILFLVIVLNAVTGCAQSTSQKKETSIAKHVGGPCEGCEAIHESPVPFDQLNDVDTLPDFGDEGPKLEVSGIVYERDGKTPAEGVVLYVYHTNQEGIYPKRGNETGWGERHGYIRGWVKTNERGEYKFYTLRPGAYPGRNNPEHIHITVKEPGMNEYFIDDYHFADDTILQKTGNNFGNRGGNGILKVTTNNGRQLANRDIILGLNIPGYPG